MQTVPGTAFGCQFAHISDYAGSDSNYILEALRDAGGPVHTRPGGGYCNDRAPYGQFVKAMALSYRLPDYAVENLAKIEDLPGVAYGKGIQGIINKGALDLAVG